MTLKIIGAFIILIGVILIFDSRRLVKKYFKEADENMTTLGTKILGTILVFVGGIVSMI